MVLENKNIFFLILSQNQVNILNLHIDSSQFLTAQYDHDFAINRGFINLYIESLFRPIPDRPTSLLIRRDPISTKFVHALSSTTFTNPEDDPIGILT